MRAEAACQLGKVRSWMENNGIPHIFPGTPPGRAQVSASYRSEWPAQTWSACQLQKYWLPALGRTATKAPTGARVSNARLTPDRLPAVHTEPHLRAEPPHAGRPRHCGTQTGTGSPRSCPDARYGRCRAGNRIKCARRRPHTQLLEIATHCQPLDTDATVH